MRDKKGTSAADRLPQFLKSPIFTSTGRTSQDLLFEKVHGLVGDASVEKFGLSDGDWSKLANEVNIIINSAASVRFDDPMKKALAINVLPTITCLKLARQAKDLAAYVHVSTTYAYSQLPVTEERVHPIVIHPDLLLKKANLLDDGTLDEQCKKLYFEGRPNSYLFTKSVAENYLLEHAQGLPVAIGRLSMITVTRYEPEPGFIDVLQAANVLAFVGAIGALRVFNYDPSIYVHGMAVDTAANSLLAIGYLTATKYRQSDMRVYNITQAYVEAQIVQKICTDVFHEYPSSTAFRTPADLSGRPSKLWYTYNRWISEWLFVFVIDKILICFGFN